MNYNYRSDNLDRLFEKYRECDVFVTQDIDNKDLAEKAFPLYESIEQLCLDLGHRLFIPHRAIGFDGDANALNPAETHTLSRMMIDNSKIILDYVPPSVGAGHMTGMAMLAKKPMIFFYEKSRKLETVNQVRQSVAGTSLDTADDEILRSPHAFYFHDTPFAPLEPYKHLLGVVRFNTIDECINLLRPKIISFFKT
ncbi:hypothetical protein KW787_02800 [Candidatus Pacearchaeota archaeon]|nr:hypothetical protein [Candidatus Pacearchaeota archaeon]